MTDIFCFNVEYKSYCTGVSVDCPTPNGIRRLSIVAKQVTCRGTIIDSLIVSSVTVKYAVFDLQLCGGI